MIAAGIIGFVVVDLLFLAANLPKIAQGGWFPLVVGAVVLLLLTTWDQGRRRVTERRTAAEGPLSDFIEEMHSGNAPRHAAAGACDLPEPVARHDPARAPRQPNPAPRDPRRGRDRDRRDHERAVCSP